MSEAPPQTLVDRVAWALCAHDIMAGEGRMTDDELAQLEALLAEIAAIRGRAVCWERYRLLQAFAGMERAFRQHDGMAVARMKMIRADWPHYRAAAAAAVAVLAERPEAAAHLEPPDAD